MQRSKSFNIKFGFDFSNRKYKMIGLELLICFLIVVINQIIMLYWPIEEPLRTFTDDYWLYMLFALFEVLLIGLIAFVLGVWYSQWRIDKNVRIPEDMELEDIP